MPNQHLKKASPVPVKVFLFSLFVVLAFSPALTPALASAWLGRMADAPDMPERNMQAPGTWREITVFAKPLIDRDSLIESGQPAPPNSGKLAYRGGLVLTSKDKGFGGFSAMRFVPRQDGTGLALLALSDRAQWLKADIAFDKQGVPTGLGKPIMAAILKHDGKALKSMEGDAEALEVTEQGFVLGFERYHRLDLYGPDEQNIYRYQRRILHNRLVDGLNNNQSLESVAQISDGRLITFAENPPGKNGSTINPGWISLPANWQSGGDDWVPVKFQTAPDFAITEMATDRQTGDLFVLERAFSPLAGPRARLSRIKAADISPGIVLPAELLGALNIAFGIDNMEAMDLRRLDDGTLLVYLLSDDNFSINQRTVMLVFEITE
jgi:hypothetical protein